MITVGVARETVQRIVPVFVPVTLGFGVAALAWFCRVDVPSIASEDVAAAMGRHPSDSIHSGLWCSLTAALFSLLGPNTGLKVLCAFGPVSLGCIAMLAGFLLRGILPVRFSAFASRTVCGRWIVSIMLALVVLTFVLSGPIWRTGYFLSSMSLRLLLMFTAFLILAQIVRGSARRTNLCSNLFAVLTGILAMDTPFAVLVFVLLPVAFSGRFSTLPDGTVVSFASPFVVLLVMWRTALVFLAAWAVALAASVAFESGAMARDAASASVHAHRHSPARFVRPIMEKRLSFIS